jgi:hypothetical protein
VTLIGSYFGSRCTESPLLELDPTWMSPPSQLALAFPECRSPGVPSKAEPEAQAELTRVAFRSPHHFRLRALMFAARVPGGSRVHMFHPCMTVNSNLPEYVPQPECTVHLPRPRAPGHLANTWVAACAALFSHKMVLFREKNPFLPCAAHSAAHRACRLV